MIVIRPSKNRITCDPKCHGYLAWDFAGLEGDQFIRSSIDGEIIEAKYNETRNWLAFTSNDPFKNARNGKLLTSDYGNYLKIKGSIIHLVTHLKANTGLPIGTKVKAGQIIAEVGSSGNSSGKHSHNEYRTLNGTNISDISFKENGIIPEEDYMPQYFKTLLQENNLDLNNEGSIREFFQKAKEFDNLLKDKKNIEKDMDILKKKLESLLLEVEDLKGQIKALKDSKPPTTPKDNTSVDPQAISFFNHIWKAIQGFFTK